MTLRLHTFLTGLLALLMALLLALAPAGAKPASGGYQLFESAASGDQHAISLAYLENFDYYAKIAPECCNATKKGTGGVLVGDSYVPSGAAIVRNGTVQLDRTITTKTGRTIPSGSVVTENGGAIKIVTPDGPTITDKTDSFLGSQQLQLPPPAPKGTSGVLVGDSYVPRGSDVVRNGTVRLDRTITTKTGGKIPAGSVVTENGGAIKIFTPDGRTITRKTDSFLGSQQLKLPPPAPKKGDGPYEGPVQIGQTTTYGDSVNRSVVGDGLSGDHMPSRAAIQTCVETEIGRPLTQAESKKLRNSTGCVIVTGGGHCALSNTFSGRNTPDRILNNSGDLRAAADSDFTAMIPDRRANGMTSEQINAARTRLHQLNGSIIDDLNAQYGTQITY